MRLKVRVQGHYLKQESAAAASSFSLGSLPASDLDWKKTRRVIFRDAR